MSKTFIYVLSMPKCGTEQLSIALKKIGITSYHELIDIHDAYFPWMKKRFSNPQLSLVEAAEIFESKFLTYLENQELIADISHYLSPFYPLVEYICKKNNIETRAIHLCRKYWPQRLITYKHPDSHTFKPIKLFDGMPYISNEKYYYAELSWCTDDINWNDWISFSPFERLCYYYKYHNEYFLKSKYTVFHVEDYNSESLEILKILYPEATEEQKSIFHNALVAGYPQRSTDYWLSDLGESEKITFESICGSTLKALDYKE